MSSISKQRKGKTDSVQQTTKIVKGESKQDPSTKQADKTQPTAEQMRIAQIIDTKLEDPSLKDKIRQVMDATQKSEDEVCTALHDCDNDPDRAVNLLIEGVQSEWSSIKKKKRGEKSKDITSYIHQPPAEDSDWDADLPEDNINQKSVDSRLRGRTQRGVTRGQWRGRENKENEHHTETERDRGRRGRMVNGPSRGRGGGRGGRGFTRGRPPFRRHIETWDCATTNSHDEGPGQVEDWDNEEYTGSLADSKVFTASTVTESGQTEEEVPQDDQQSVHSVSPDEDQPSMSAVQFLSQFASNQTNKSGPAISNSSVFHESHFARETFPSTFTMNSFSSQVPERTSAPVLEDVRLPRVPRMRARIPPPSKIPSSAVEMPPDAVGSGMALLDVQFGNVLDISDTNDSVTQPTGSSPPPLSPSPVSSEKLSNAPAMSVTESLLISSDSSFSPARSTVSSSISQMNELNASKSAESVQPNLYQDTVYQSTQFSKSSHVQPSSFAATFTNAQVPLTSSGYSTVSNITVCASGNTSTSVSNYTSSPYPQYQGYTNYPSQSTTAAAHLHSTNSYQSGGVTSQYSCNQNSVYGGSANLGSTTSSYSTPYQTYSVSSQQTNHKTGLSSVTANSKDFETSTSVNLNTVSQPSSISAPTLLTSTQTTCTSKPSAMSTMSKGAVVAGVPPGVPPIVGTQYIMSQSGVPYFQQPLYGYEELQLLPQQRIPPHLPTGYYEVGYQTQTTREGVQYNISDARFARADNNTSPVQVSSISQQSGTQAHQQQPLMNPTAIPPAYAYFYQGSMIPGNFQYGPATLYPVAATGTGSGHSSSSGIYGKGPTNYTSGYANYESVQSTGNEYKGPSQVPKTQSVQTNTVTSTDMALYTKTHPALSKSYEKPGFHSGTPPPFTLSSQNSGIGGGYAPQHLFIPAMTHHNTPMMHQPLHQEGASASVPGRAQVGSQANKVVNKANYSPSTYWAQN